MLWLPTSIACSFQAHRIGAGLSALSRLSKLQSPIKLTLATLLSYMMRAVDTNPIVKELYIRHALMDLNFHGIVGRFGMFFLHDLNWNASSGESLLPEIENDTQAMLASIKATVTGPQLYRHSPTLDLTDEEDLNDYPLGRNPTWAAIKRCLLNRPLILLKAWHALHHLQHHTQVGGIFVMFTNQFWLYIHKDQLVKDYLPVSTLEEAMAIWKVQNIQSFLQRVDFIPCNAGLPGSRPGVQDMPFRDRRHIFFPPSGSKNHPESKWNGFLRSNGYLARYHQLLEVIKESGDDAQSLQNAVDEDLAVIFGHLQCLPLSRPSSKSSPGVLWTQINGRAQLTVNPVYFKIKGVGNSGDGHKRNKPFAISRKEFEKAIGHQGSSTKPPERNRRRRLVSSRTLGRRKPPIKKNTLHGSSEEISSGNESTDKNQTESESDGNQEDSEEEMRSDDKSRGVKWTSRQENSKSNVQNRNKKSRKRNGKEASMVSKRRLEKILRILLMYVSSLSRLHLNIGSIWMKKTPLL